MNVEALVVDVLAVHRLTRLVTADTITEPARRRIIQWAYRNACDTVDHGTIYEQRATGERIPGSERPQLSYRPVTFTDPGSADVRVEADGPAAPKLATLVHCRWCASVWIAAGVVIARRAAPRWWSPVARLLALSSTSTLLARAEAD